MDQVAPRTSTLAIVSLIFGVLGWTFLFVIGHIVAVITGHLARREIRDSNGALQGDGLALAGMVLGYIGLLAVVMAVAILIGLIIIGVLVA